jgi:hypothetical protein
MTGVTVNELIPILQIAIGPVILVSGVGLLLLTMTNRLARVIDRARILSQERRQPGNSNEPRLVGQLNILAHRAELLRRAITLGAISVLLAAVLVIVLFLAALLRLEDPWLISVLFICCMISLIGSLSAFILELNQSLIALKLEMEYQE